MMKLNIYTSEKVQQYIKKRKGEKKYGERVHYITDPAGDPFAQLKESRAEYVLLGIPEAIGIQANSGKKDATSAWEATLRMLLNTQQNNFNKGNRLYILGHLDVEQEMETFHSLDLSDKKDRKAAGKLVEAIDKEVTYIISKIVASGKKPIVVGGGHNNAYGIIKGCSLGLRKPVNSVNFDLYSGFMSTKGRHNGNGFSYAFQEGFLNRYYSFGLHENYTSRSVFNMLEKHRQHIQYITFEDILIRQKRSFLYYLNQALSYVKERSFGVEMDCRAIANIPTGAMTPSGFSTNHARRFASFMGTHKNAAYLHICEAAPDPDNEAEMQQTGKLIAYLITDFIKG